MKKTKSPDHEKFVLTNEARTLLWVVAQQADTIVL